jgi:hypothetical protein
MTKFKLSATKIKFYSSLTPEQFERHADKIWSKLRHVVLCKRKETKVRLEQEYTALLDLYKEQFNIKIGTLVENNIQDYRDWSEDECDFYIVEKFMYESFNDHSDQPILSVITNDDEDPTHIISYKAVTPERFQWMVNNYPEKMIMLWNKPKLKLKTNPLFTNIKWPKKLEEEKKLVDDLASIGL